MELENSMLRPTVHDDSYDYSDTAISEHGRTRYLEVEITYLSKPLKEVANEQTKDYSK